jgi:hypothetical protein
LKSAKADIENPDQDESTNKEMSFQNSDREYERPTAHRRRTTWEENEERTTWEEQARTRREDKKRRDKRKYSRATAFNQAIQIEFEQLKSESEDRTGYLMILDLFTGFALAAPIRRFTPWVIQQLVQQWIEIYGKPGRTYSQSEVIGSALLMTGVQNRMLTTSAPDTMETATPMYVTIRTIMGIQEPEEVEPNNRRVQEKMRKYNNTCQEGRRWTPTQMHNQRQSRRSERRDPLVKTFNDRVQIQFQPFDPWTTTRRGTLFIEDYRTKYVQGIEIEKLDTPNFTRGFFKQWIRLNDKPTNAYTDQEETADMLEIFDVTLVKQDKEKDHNYDSLYSSTLTREAFQGMRSTAAQDHDPVLLQEKIRTYNQTRRVGQKDSPEALRAFDIKKRWMEEHKQPQATAGLFEWTREQEQKSQTTPRTGDSKELEFQEGAIGGVNLS